jgi:N-acetylmuramoyl-L-alanine amidase
MEIILEEPGLAESGEGLQSWEAVQGAHRRASLELGLDIQRALRPMGDWRQLGIRRENSAVLQGLDMPALMLELGNLDSGVERAAWEDPPTRARRLRALADALARESERWEKEGRP